MACALVVAVCAAPGLVGCATPRGPAATRDQLLAARAHYPAHWWAPVSREGAPEWEILPHEAGPGEVIVSKRHELGLLSNFASTPFTFRGRRYASLEGFWQMMLYPEGPDDPRATFPGLAWAHTRDEVGQMTAFEAKAAGTLAEQNMARMGITWVSFEGSRFEYRPRTPGTHYALIVAAMRAKVRQNDDVRRVLLATGDLVLRPDHHEEADAPDAWKYCRILMQLRAELRGADRDVVTASPASRVAVSSRAVCTRWPG
ncbi:MAG: NADAR family protein [Acidobacteriota bacterium]